MKEAIGYITEDGKFFESAEEAEENEAWEALGAALDTVSMIDGMEFMKVLATIPQPIRRYINANEAAIRYREIQASLSAQDQARREDNSQALFEQQARIDESLPNMGSGVVEEAVQQQRPIDGIGSGRTDASNVRSSSDMAVGTHSRSAKARLNSSTSNIRQGKME